MIPEAKRVAGKSQVATEHRIPCGPVQAILRNNGITSVSKATTWGAEHYAEEILPDGKTKVLISSHVIENVFRGVTATLRFEQVDLILKELDSPDEWFYPPLSDFYVPEGYVPEPEYETFLPQAEADAAARDLMLDGLETV